MTDHIHKGRQNAEEIVKLIRCIDDAHVQLKQSGFDGIEGYDMIRSSWVKRYEKISGRPYEDRNQSLLDVF